LVAGIQFHRLIDPELTAICKRAFCPKITSHNREGCRLLDLVLFGERYGGSLPVDRKPNVV
jgi:hypothetical protein